MTDYKDIFNEYEALVAKADQAFGEMQKQHGPCIRCDVQCSDCCSAVFGLFLIESAYLNHRLNELDENSKQQILARAEQSEKEILKMQQQLKEYADDPKQLTEAISKARVRCPLLNDEQKCSIYQYRPITCRVYGIPTVISGKIHACWKAGFEKGQAYPAFDLDQTYQELYRLSRELLKKAGVNDMERASLLVSVANALKNPEESLFKNS